MMFIGPQSPLYAGQSTKASERQLSWCALATLLPSVWLGWLRRGHRADASNRPRTGRRSTVGDQETTKPARSFKRLEQFRSWILSAGGPSWPSRQTSQPTLQAEPSARDLLRCAGRTRAVPEKQGSEWDACFDALRPRVDHDRRDLPFSGKASITSISGFR